MGCPAEILNEHGTIQAEFLPQARQIVRGRPGSKQNLRWVAGRQMEHEKDNKRHADDHDHCRDQSPDEIAPHLRVEVRFRWGWPCSCRQKGLRGYSRVV